VGFSGHGASEQQQQQLDAQDPVVRQVLELLAAGDLSQDDLASLSPPIARQLTALAAQQQQQQQQCGSGVATNAGGGGQADGSDADALVAAPPRKGGSRYAFARP
jgi:hypothetical protein